MPTKRRRRLSKRIVQLTEEQREKLLTGLEFFGKAFESEDREREAWFDHRDDLLNYWLLDLDEIGPQDPRDRATNPLPAGPGHRPAGWWKFEAPTLRRRIGGKGDALMDSPNCPEWAAKTSFGMPSVFDGYNYDNPPRYESEAAYLTRHGLLSAEEKTALKRAVHKN